MKRLILFFALLLVSASLLAQPADRSILLAPDGTLYTAESKFSQQPDMASVRYIQLAIQTATGTIKTTVPASVEGGYNWQPELAFDSESQMLFVFWLRSQNSILAASELVFCTYQNGRWNAASSIDDIPYHSRSNLKIGVTRSMQIEADGNLKQIPALSVHVAWWDAAADLESGEYAMLTVEKGVVTAIYRRALSDFMDRAYLRTFATNPASLEVMRHPEVLESPAHDTIDIVFGDMPTNTMHRITLMPVLNTRVRIPIGVRDTAYPVPDIQIEPNSAVSAMNTTPDRLVLYYQPAPAALKYVAFENGKWSTTKSVALSSEVSAEAAVAALRRLMNGD